MAVLKDAKTVGATFPNAADIVKVTYDFSKDGGAIADYDVLVADSACIVEHVYTLGVENVTSADAIAIDLGKGAGGVEFHSDVLKAALEADDLISGAGKMVELTVGEKIVLGIEAFAATGGKFDMCFRVYKK